jgi:hypothetical protein
MAKWLPLVALVTAGLVYWFGVAFMSDNNDAWWTSEAVQIVTGLGTLVGMTAIRVMTGLAVRRAVRQRRSVG